ncbi:polymorphic toxin-type HINT domain-containing protein [Streptomyces sp. CA-294286]|uniref:polymorphic toxin-type HINT domain-containing protein n=1 Tax=Streptomyces sp. CA-294286 TaxID=3240070 RepID=UPI003D8B0CBF
MTKVESFVHVSYDWLVLRRRWLIATAVAFLSMLVTLIGTSSPAAAKPGKPDLVALQEEKPVKTEEFRAGEEKLKNGAAGNWQPEPASVPTGEAHVDLAADAPSSGQRSAASSPLKASGLPVYVKDGRQGSANSPRGPTAGASTVEPNGVDVEMLPSALPEKLNADGPVVKLTGTGAAASGGTSKSGTAALRSAPARPTEVQLDYSDFEHLYGGDWGSRLNLVQLPACAETAPERPECQTSVPVPTKNDSAARRLTATVPLAAGQPVLLAARAAAGGGGGSFGATSLAPSGSWSAGGSAGGFSWSYPLEAPEVPGGPEPEIALSYSSQSVDGRTALTNNQSSWIGEGWDYHPGFVERRYKSCSDDMGTGANNKTKTGDLCWFADSVTLSLDGVTNELVRDDKTGAWKLADDDGSRIELKKGGVNGDNDGEHWVLTSTDGTQYWFGLNRLPGWADGSPQTNSTLAVPVFGNHAGEQCHTATFDTSECNQGWRWNLDYVVDPHGNAMSLWWEKETNHYGKQGKADKPVKYDRGSYLSRIDYGQRSNTLFTAKAPARMLFSVAERCIPTSSFDCAPSKLDKTNAKNWPDVPFDLKCDAGAKCTDKYTPSFWTTKRLTTITSEALSGTAHTKADTWELKNHYPPSTVSPALWLDSIKRTGHTGGTTTAMPPVTFAGEQLDNRVYGANGIEPFSRYRIHAIRTEHGSTTGITYSARECAVGSTPAPENNSKRCYPTYWSPEWADKPILDWFHKYVVTEVREEDNVADSLPKVTSYQYLGGAGWAWDDSEMNEDKNRTWSQYRGYGKVRTLVGRGDDGVRSMTEELYYRGLHGDRLPGGATRVAEVVDSEGGKVLDLPQFAGQAREEVDYSKEGGVIESAARVTPESAVTATRARKGTTALNARIGNPQTSEDRTLKADGSWERTKETSEYDAHGLPSRVHDFGNVADPNDDACTTLSYVRNTAKWILDLESQEKTVTGACGATGGSTVSDTRTSYDGQPFGSAPAKGDVTTVEEMTADGTGFQVAERTEYDLYGRPTVSYDTNGAATRTAYTPATGANPTQTVVTNPLGHTETVHSDQVRGSTTAIVDTNGRRSDMAHDGLGRLTKVWDINRNKAAGQSPTAEYAYSISPTAPATETTRTLREDGSYETAVEIMDGLLRPRQSQDPGIGGGRIITDTIHDTHGRVVKANNNYFTTGAPGSQLLSVADNLVPHQTVTTLDGRGRPIAETVRRYGEDQNTTKTEYKGQETTVVPPQGETVTQTTTDSENRTTRLREYLDAGRTKYNDTTYTYDRKGQLTKVTDPAGNNWTFEYDARGRQTKAVDPDAGTTLTTYDKDDRPVTVTDALGKKTSTTYDVLDRPTSLREGGPDGPKLSEWTYDTLLKGLPTASIRHHGGKEYRTEATGYNQAYQPTGTKLVIPDSEGKLAGTYTYGMGYTPNTGLPMWTQRPKVGPLNAERVATRYTAEDMPQVIGGHTVYADNLQYSASGELLRSDTGLNGKKIYSTSFYDEHTRRLSRVLHDRDGLPGQPGNRIDETTYGYDPAGNVKKIARTPGKGMPDGVGTDTQCFAYDALRRMTHAWTATDGCAATTPNKAVVGGLNAYWQSYSYDAVGNRTKLVEHDTTGNTAKDITRTYTYPGAGKSGPRSLTKVESSGPSGTTVDSYGYDAAGNTTTRQVGGTTQTLSYNSEGSLSRISANGKNTDYLYDADGSRLIHRAPDGSTTLYLGESELTVDAKGTLSTDRFYELPDGSTFVRSATEGDLTKGMGTQNVLLNDHHGSGQSVVSLDQPGLPVERRLLKPFGEERAKAPTSWPGDRGFVGGRQNKDTGLTQLGARDYDPATGRFTTVDPIIAFGIPQQMNPYAYANNAPATEEDASGLFFPAVIGAAIWAHRAYKAYQAYKKWKKAQQAIQRLIKLKKQRERAEQIRKAKEAQEKARRAQKAKDAAKAKAKAKADAARKLRAAASKKAKPRVAKKAAPKRAAKFRSAPKQRPKPSSKPGARPKPNPKPKSAKPQGSRQVKKEIKQEAREQAKEQVQEAVQPQQSSCNTSNSFVPQTPVLMADGSYKAIEDIKTGDKVLATDPETGITKAEPVVATIIGEGSKDLVKITIRTDGERPASGSGETRGVPIDQPELTTQPDGESTGTLIATDGHPFWVPELGKWIDAGELQPNQWLQTSAGSWVQITAVQAFTQNASVRNLTVADTHTYHVLAGAAPVLVHNCNGVSIYRTPKVDDMAHELERGPNPASHQDGDASVYLGEKSVAKEYQNRGSYANGSIRYDMHDDFLKEFSDTAFRYDRKGPGGSARIEFVIPVGRLDRFNELTLRRLWEPGNR